MNILIIEDEKHAADRLTRLLKAHFPDANYYADVDSVKSALRWFKENPEPDLIFLDIQLADGLSFDIFNTVQVLSPVIFCTAYDQYAIKAFELNSLDYLLKPIDPMDLEKSVKKYQQLNSDKEEKPALDFSSLQALLENQNQKYKKRFVVKLGDKIVAIETSDIAFFYSENKGTYAQNHQGKSYLIDFSLDQLVDLVDLKKFYRINRKYLASYESLGDIRSYSNSRLKVMLKNNSDNDILMSREKVTDFKNWLDQ
jgi:DNA-binding LytR/AlgR family response regulator